MDLPNQGAMFEAMKSSMPTVMFLFVYVHFK